MRIFDGDMQLPLSGHDDGVAIALLLCFFSFSTITLTGGGVAIGVGAVRGLGVGVTSTNFCSPLSDSKPSSCVVLAYGDEPTDDTLPESKTIYFMPVIQVNTIKRNVFNKHRSKHLSAINILNRSISVKRLFGMGQKYRIISCNHLLREGLPSSNLLQSHQLLFTG